MEIGKSLKDSMLIAGAVSLDLVKQIRFRRAGGIFSSRSNNCSTFRNGVCYTGTSKKSNSVFLIS